MLSEVAAEADTPKYGLDMRTQRDGWVNGDAQVIELSTKKNESLNL